MMTVAELILELQQFDQSMEVFMFDAEWGCYDPIEKVFGVIEIGDAITFGGHSIKVGGKKVVVI